MKFEIGNTVGTYKIVAAIGSGGMGEVLQVEHAVTNRAEAMKIVAANASSTPEQDQRFLREIQLQARLSHPNIAAVHNAFWQDGHLILIMELIHGQPLRILLQDGKLPLATAIDYACQALEALDYAHARGVVHRDISPSNMIITQDGTLKLTDFGLAKSRTDMRLTETGALLGSLYYTPPEQIRGEANLDARSDIYSLGVVLFEMVTGAKLFHSENPFTMMLAHTEQMPPRASEVDPDLPPALDEILLKALQKDPRNRFQTAELFRCALEGVKDIRIREGIAGPAGTQICPLPPAEPDPVTPLALGRAGMPTRSTGFTIFQTRLVKVAAVVMFILASSYLWNTALSPAPQRSGTAARPLDFAALPVTWPKHLILFPEVTYRAPHKASSPRTTATPLAFAALPVTWSSDLMQHPEVTYPAPHKASSPRSTAVPSRNALNKQDGQPVRKKHNLFVRAMSRVVHPFHGSSENTTAETSRDSADN